MTENNQQKKEPSTDNVDEMPSIDELINYDVTSSNTENTGRSKIMRNVLVVAGGVATIGLVVLALTQFSLNEEPAGEVFSEQDKADLIAGKQNSASGKIVSIDSKARSFVLDTTAFSEGGEHSVKTARSTRFEVYSMPPLPELSEEVQELLDAGEISYDDLDISREWIVDSMSFSDLKVGDSVAIEIAEFIFLAEATSLDAVAVYKVMQ